MIRRVICGVLVTGFVLLAGCSQGPAGNWQTQSVSPAMARDQIRFLRSSEYEGNFVKATIDLKKDRNYVAEVYYAGDMEVSTGTWMYDAGRLSLLDNKYGNHVYTAEIADGGKTLKIIQPIKGTNVVLQMSRMR